MLRHHKHNVEGYKTRQSKTNELLKQLLRDSHITNDSIQFYFYKYVLLAKTHKNKISLRSLVNCIM